MDLGRSSCLKWRFNGTWKDHVETTWGLRSTSRYGFTFYSPEYEEFITAFLVGGDLNVPKIIYQLEMKRFG